MVIRLGIIGLSADQMAWAKMAHVVPLKLPILSKHYTIVALATSSPESAKKAAKFHDIPEDKAYSNPEAIANDPDVDMIVVSVKIPLHRQLTLPALKAKKDVFVEWPLGKNLAEAEEMAALAKSMGVKTVVGLQARQSPSIQKAKEIIMSGALGRILSTSLVGYDSVINKLPEKAIVFQDPANGADLITVPAAHALDALCYLVGEFSNLSATTTTQIPTTDFFNASGTVTHTLPRAWADSLAISGVLASGANATFVYYTCTTATPSTLTWIISGEKGSLKLEGNGSSMATATPNLYQYKNANAEAHNVYEPGEQPKNEAKWDEVKVEPGVGGFGGVGDLYHAYVRGDKEGFVDFEGAVVRHRMVEAIKRSAKNGVKERYI